MHNEISYEDFNTITNKEMKWNRTLEESVRIMKSQRSGKERNKLVKIVKNWISMKLFKKNNALKSQEKHIIDIL